MVRLSTRFASGALLVWLAGASGLIPDDAREPKVKNIAIIGAGAAGSSTAYHLRKFADQDGVALNITVFEKTSRVGGRTLTVNAFDDPLEPVELGASIFVDVNTILYDGAHEFNLSLSDVSGVDGTMVIWDGESFRFSIDEGSWSWWSYAKLFWKYGLAPYKTQKLVRSTVETFLHLYKAPHFPFKSLSERASELGLTKTTGMTGLQFLEENGITPLFAQDIIQASTRVNYATNLAHIHGLETMVSMAPEGAVQVEGGNWQIFAKMLMHSSAALCLETEVISVKAGDENRGRYTITTRKAGDGDAEAETDSASFDQVVIATPWQFSGIDTSHDLFRQPIDEIPYVQLHVTLFTSPFKLAPEFFGLAPGTKTPVTVLTTLHPEDEAQPGADAAGKAGFFSISTLRHILNPKTMGQEYVYKVFSPEALDEKFLSSLLGVQVPEGFTAGEDDDAAGAISWWYPHVFNSYPIEFPRVTFQDPVLGEGMYYTSGIESFISTMETSSLMGKNVARLIVDELSSRDLEADGRLREKEASEAAADNSIDEL